MFNVKRACVVLGIICLFIGSFVGVYVFEYQGDTNISKPNKENEPSKPIEEEPSEKEPSEKEPSEKEPIEEPEYIDYLKENGTFELPINGASGYAAIDMELKENKNDNSKTLDTIKAGSGFTILKEEGDYFQVNYNAKIGYLKHQLCFINLPDIIPSIVYNITNSKSSKMVSSGINIPNITNEKLYDAYKYNARFDTKEYIVPVLYSMAKKIATAQHYAMEEGNTLIIYEAFRPYEVQRKIVNNLSELALNNPIVNEGITTAPWSMVWFISTGISNHQRGCAIDVSLGKIIETEEKHLGNYIYKDITKYEEYVMFTNMHELSIASVIYPYQVDSSSKEAWKNVKLLDNVNPEARTLQGYCTKADLSPLASEWWHFNDLDSLKNAVSKGNFLIETNYSMSLEETKK